jgi:hypothetical protein
MMDVPVPQCQTENCVCCTELTKMKRERDLLQKKLDELTDENNLLANKLIKLRCVKEQ